MTSNNSSKTPSSIDDLVKFIAKSVGDHYEKSGRRMDGSLLSYIIRSEYPAIDYTRLGLLRLGDAVRIAEKSKLVVRHRDVRHLELSPPDASENAQAAAESSAVDERRYVRNDIWRAFVFRSRSTTFLDRDSLTLTEIPEENSKEIFKLRRTPLQCEIERISEDNQIAWAKQFISSSSNTDEISDDDARSLLFAKGNKYSVAYIRSWKAFLSSKVIDYIRVWATDNDISTDQILVPTKKRYDLERFGVRPTDEAKIRRAIIAAIEDMPLSELDEVALPIKYVRRHFTAK